MHCQGNGGVSSARNAGIERSRGIYVAFVDSDDYVDENYLRKLANVLISDPELDLVACGHLKVWEDGRKKSHCMHIRKRTRKCPLFVLSIYTDIRFAKYLRMKLLKSAIYVLIQDL